MRSWLDFVTCWGPQESERWESEGPPPAEETRALVPSVRRSNRQTKRRRGGSPGPVEWKPSLTVISEDKAVAAAPEKKVEERPMKRKSGGASPRSRIHTQNSGRSPMETIIPGLAPTPFMF